MRKKEEKEVIEITEDIKIREGIILEKGDRIQILEKSSYFFSNKFMTGKVDLDKKTVEVFLIYGDDFDTVKLANYHHILMMKDIKAELAKQGLDIEFDTSKTGHATESYCLVYIK